MLPFFFNPAEINLLQFVQPTPYSTNLLQILILYLVITEIFFLYLPRGCPRGVMVKSMDCGIIVSEFALLHSLSGKYPWERYEPPYPPSYGLNSTTTVLLGE